MCPESYLALLLGRHLAVRVQELQSGLVLGADGMLRLSLGIVRIPDVSFISWERLGAQRLGDRPIPDCVPDLAVEVISPHNTREEMSRKLREYFEAGVRLVWYVYPSEREVHVYTAPEERIVLRADGHLDGGAVLPGFRLDLQTLFAPPEPPDAAPPE